METPVPDHYRPIRFSQVEVGMEVFVYTRFASGTEITYQGHVAAKGYTVDDTPFIHFRGAPFAPIPPYPVEFQLWEVMWQGPSQSEPEPEPTTSRLIQEAFTVFADEINRELRVAR